MGCNSEAEEVKATAQCIRVDPCPTLWVSPRPAPSAQDQGGVPALQAELQWGQKLQLTRPLPREQEPGNKYREEVDCSVWGEMTPQRAAGGGRERGRLGEELVSHPSEGQAGEKL